MLKELFKILREEQAKKARLKQIVNNDVDYKLLQSFVDNRPNDTEIVIRDQLGMRITIRKITDDINADQGKYFK